MANSYRPRLPDYFEQYIEKIKEYRVEDLEALFNGKSKKDLWDEKEDGATFEYVGTKSITTLEDALEYCKADLTKWKVSRKVFNSWDVTMKLDDMPHKVTNYQFKLWFEPLDQSWEDFYKALSKESKKIKSLKIKKAKGSGIGVLNITDLHIGAEVRDLVRTPDFDMTTLGRSLKLAAEEINAKEYNEVHLNILGDLVESISGANHPNTFKSLARNGYGYKIIIQAYKIIKDNLIAKINNLVAVNIVGGNHDRLTMKSDLDNEGSAAALIAFMLQNNSEEISIDFNPIILVKEIDGINYLLTHGDKRLSRDNVKLINDFGRTDIFNVSLQGHLHTLKASKTLKAREIKYQDVTIIDFDELNYRAYTVPSLFTGNFFSESLGFGTNAGVLITENNGKGKINSFEITL